MTQEEKFLLLKDLSGRLPYGVKIYFGGIPKLLTSITIKTGYIEILVEGEYGKAAYCDFISTYNNTEYLQKEITEKCKPYLRTMSSMTEEELKELKTLCSIYIPTNCLTIGFEDYGIIVFTHHLTNNTYSFKLNIDIIDWLNAHHFDYHDLIEKGLAIEAPDGMYEKF